MTGRSAVTRGSVMSRDAICRAERRVARSLARDRARARATSWSRRATGARTVFPHRVSAAPEGGAGRLQARRADVRRRGAPTALAARRCTRTARWRTSSRQSSSSTTSSSGTSSISACPARSRPPRSSSSGRCPTRWCTSSDVVQRIGRRREHKTQDREPVPGWHDMLLNARARRSPSSTASDRVRVPTAELAMEHTDPSADASAASSSSASTTAPSGGCSEARARTRRAGGRSTFGREPTRGRASRSPRASRSRRGKDDLPVPRRRGGPRARRRRGRSSPAGRRGPGERTARGDARGRARRRRARDLQRRRPAAARGARARSRPAGTAWRSTRSTTARRRPARGAAARSTTG